MIRTVRLAELDPADRRRLTRRRPLVDAAIREQARTIVESIRTGGDAALRAANHRYGGGRPGDEVAVAPAEIATASTRVEPEFRRALEAAAAAIRRVHEGQLPAPSSVAPVEGVEVTREWAPLRRVGIYVPGGLAPYPSSVLMGAVPAAIAGVPEIVVASPAAADGTVAAAVLAACAVGGVTEVYAMGGAQAIAALAYGTETITPVDKIVGPGNAWVTAAKLEVFGACAIDLPAGPSEALEIADDTASPVAVAADLISQAEHGPDSVAVLVTVGEETAASITAEVGRLLERLGRRDIIRTALKKNALVAIAADISSACAFANEFAPEHLGIHTADPEAVADRVPAAGSVFLGHYAPHSAGDYATGANHVLPTGGLARSSSPLSVADFGSYRQVQRISREGLERIRPTVAALAAGEGLTAHGLAVDIRFEEMP